LSGLDHVMVFTAAETNLGGGQETFPLIHQRTYYMKLKKNPKGGKAPVPYLTPSGPDMDFKVCILFFLSCIMFYALFFATSCTNFNHTSLSKKGTTNSICITRLMENGNETTSGYQS